MKKFVKTKYKGFGEGFPCYVIAEMSANHGGDLARALEIVHLAKDAGADCVKIQTYTADTLTIDSDKDSFSLKEGTWAGENLYKLYQKAYTPWDWQARIKEEAEKIGLDFFSTAYDNTAVDFLEDLGVDFYKIASFEVIDIPLIRYVASKKKPILISTGMASVEEIDDAYNAVVSQNNDALCLLKCSSGYPALPEDMNLNTMKDLALKYQTIVGLSDHSLGDVAATTAVAMGAKVVEKHFCLSRKQETPDSSFSMEPDEFKKMVANIRTIEKVMGTVTYDVSEWEAVSKKNRKSIFVVKDIKVGEKLNEENIRIIRPGHGLLPKEFENVLGKTASHDISSGTPLEWNMIEKQ